MDHIMRRNVRSNFTTIPNDVLDDDSISWKAKGILIYLLSKPNDWTPRTRDIANHSTDGLTSVESGIMELRKAGFAELVRETRRGQVERFILYVSDHHAFTSNGNQISFELEPIKPEPENPNLANPSLENRGLSKDLEETNTDKKQILIPVAPLPDTVLTAEEKKAKKALERKQKAQKILEDKKKFGDQAEIIYEAYPKKVAHPVAINSIVKQLQKFSFEVLLKKTQDYAVLRKFEDPQYTPNPSTWFNQQRFNDVPVIPASVQNVSPVIRRPGNNGVLDCL